MRFLRFLFFLVFLAILAGSVWYSAQMGFDWSQVRTMITNMLGNSADSHAQHQQHGMNQQMASPFNMLAAQNKDKLTQATVTLTQAMDMITTDPYSQITMPSRGEGQTAVQQGNVNVTPGTGVTVNIAPGAHGQQPRQPESPAANIVFDQSKMEQLHNGIFKFSQAIVVLQELNNDLADQSMMVESNPPDERTYMIRYNLTLQNRNKMNQVNRLLQEAMVLVNVNPYAPATGYVYNTQKMQQLHLGIFELAKSALVLSRMSEDFNQQLTQISSEARMLRLQSPQSMQGMQGMQMQHGNTSVFEYPLIVNLALAMVIFGGVRGVLVLIKRLLQDIRAA